MPYYGSGNWLGLPEFGITEKFGGNKQSLSDAEARKNKSSSNSSGQTLGSSSELNKEEATVQGPPSGWGSDRNSSSGGSSSNKNYYDVEDEKNDEDDRARRQREEEEEARNDLLRQIDEEYSSVMSNLGGQESNLRSQLPITEGQITQSYNEQIPTIQQEQGQYVSGLEGQQGTAESTAKGNINTARKQYNELLSGANRFSGSAGEAYGELLGRETAQSMGDTRNWLAQKVTEIRGEIARANQFYSSKLTNLEKSKNLAIEQARQDFRTSLQEIEAKRGEAQNWKARENLNALASFQQAVRNIDSATVSAKRALDQWAQERNASLSNTYKQAVISISDLNKANISLRPEGVGAYSNYANDPSSQNLQALQGYLYANPKSVGANSELVDPTTLVRGNVGVGNGGELSEEEQAILGL